VIFLFKLTSTLTRTRTIEGVMSFKQRKQWEGLFEDGLAVEAIDIGEGASILL
jgi:hypothetical protein